MEFYSELPVVKDFSAITVADVYRPLPENWCVFATDVVNSTKAIEAGHYKRVNILGAASVTAALNAANSADLPYAFGGDGAIVCAPLELKEAICSELAALRTLAREAYELELRAGVVSMREVVERGGQVLVSKFGVSEFYSQAVFRGGGVELAERLIKEDGEESNYSIPASTREPDLGGLECRWQDIPSPHDETLCLLVKARGSSFEEMSEVYRDVVEKIEQCFGEESNCHPVPKELLRLFFDPGRLANEKKIRRNQRSVWLQMLLGFFLMKFKISFAGVSWGKYPSDVAVSTDVRKFDDMYRQVLSGSSKSREGMVAWLEEQRVLGRLFYGAHVSDRALMTCLIFDRAKRHTHFVDAADGGYALAGKQLKSQLNELKD